MKKFLIFTLIIVLIPFLIVGLENYQEIKLKIKYGIVDNKVIRVKRVNKNRIDSVLLEDYVMGVVSGEMPISFNEEALKAQAVTARTYALKKASNSKNDYDVLDTTANQVYLDDQDLINKWSDSYDKNKQKIKNVITATKGEVILYNNELIDALYFSTSNGYTENSENVFSSEKPYLKSVDSKWDEVESPVFKTNVEVSKSTFFFNLGLEFSDKVVITNVSKTNTGRIKELYINGSKFSSNAVVKAFNLKSSSFDITVNESNNVVFSVSGFGHGVGMSQYGANGMAKQGSDYKKILNHYYQNIEIKKIH